MPLPLLFYIAILLILVGCSNLTSPEYPFILLLFIILMLKAMNIKVMLNFEF